MPERPGVAVTRADDDAAPLVAALEDVGLRAVRTPLLRVALTSPDALANTMATEAPFDWLVCTSRHGVEALAAACEVRGVSPRDLGIAAVGAVGRRTAEALQAIGVRVDLVPDIADALHLAEAILARAEGRTGRVLFPRAREAREALPTALRDAGWSVVDVACYDTLPRPEGAAQLAAALAQGAVSAVTLASGSAARALSQFVPAERWRSARLVSIGPTTTADAVACGLTIAAQASAPTVTALAAATRRILSDSLAHA